MKIYIHAIKRPLWSVTKFSAVTTLVLTVINLFVQVLSVTLGDIGLSEGAKALYDFYLLVFFSQLALYSPWVFLYGGVKLFFTSLFPSEKNRPVFVPNQTKNQTPVSMIQRRRTQIQESITQMLKENQGYLDIEDVHLLERIQEDILVNTENTYESLDAASQSDFEKEVLQSFQELEGKVTEIKAKLNRQKEQQLAKQLHLIDAITQKNNA